MRAAAKPRPAPDRRAALLLQGGGALGAYGLGAVERLYKDPAFKLTYIAGVSIGAITAAVLVGARNGDPLGTLRSLWSELSVPTPPGLPSTLRWARSLFGNARFYRPRTDLFAFPTWTSFYDTAPIRETIAGLVDFDAIMRSPVKLVVTATNIETGEIESFTNTDPKNPLTIDHILASGSLPPGFPMTRIGRSVYWDGGLFDNTPLAPLLKLIDPEKAATTQLYVVNLFPLKGRIPTDMASVGDRALEITYANKTGKDVDTARTINRFVSLVETLLARYPDAAKILAQPEFEELQRFKALDDIIAITNTRDEAANAGADFSADVIASRIATGYRDADLALKARTAPPRAAAPLRPRKGNGAILADAARHP